MPFLSLPTRLFIDYGKLIHMLMDSQNPDIQRLLGKSKCLLMLLEINHVYFIKNSKHQR